MTNSPTSPKPTFQRILLLAAPLLLAVLAYGYSVGLPLYADDAPNFWLVENINGWEQWTGSPAFPYYRPAVFTVWKLSEWVRGGHDGATLHLINVLAFGVTGVLAALWTKRLTKSTALGVLTGCGFVLFPTNYQAVNFVSSAFHLFAALGFCAATVGTLMYVDGRGPVALVFAWAIGAVGVFSHENGFLLPVLLAGMMPLAALRGPIPWRRWTVALSVPAVLAALYLAGWVWLPRAATDGVELSANPARGFVYLTHMFHYGAAGIIQRFVPEDRVTFLTLSAFHLIILVPMLALTFWRRARLGWAAIYGVGWYLLAIGPAVALLEPGYIYDSPRLALLASLGASLTYAAAIVALWNWRVVGQVASVGIVAASILVSGRFLIQRADAYARMSDYSRALFDAADQVNAAERGLLIINSPAFITQIDGARTLLTGSENVQFMTPEVDYDQYLWLNTGDRRYIEADIDTLAHFNTLRTPVPGELYVPYFPPAIEDGSAVDVVRDAPPVIATYFVGDHFYPMYVGNRANVNTFGDPLAETDDAPITLHTGEAIYHPADQTVTVELGWETGESGLPIIRFLHLMCDNRLLAQVDGSPWVGLYPFAAWEPGETHVDQHTFPAHDADSPDCLRVNLGVMWAADRERLTLTTPDGTRYQDGIVPIPLRVE